MLFLIIVRLLSVITDTIAMVQKLCQASPCYPCLAQPKAVQIALFTRIAPDQMHQVRPFSTLVRPLHNFTAHKRIRNSELLKYQHACITQQAP
ncbi:hypothetical protein DBR37_10215 [Herminiimonas sp. KBW02]|nr:hypothetical protein DBR37_10215 [Herminiimonas sp. KBW02]